MPANFPSRVTNALTALNAVTGSAVTFADRVLGVINEVFGANNPFGTASTRDTGTAEGNVPVLDAQGKLVDAVLPEGDTTGPGIVQLAGDITDTGDVVPTAAQISQAVTARFGTGRDNINADSFALFDMSAADPYISPGPGVILLMGRQQPTRLQYGSSADESERQSITAQSWSDRSTRSSPILTINQATDSNPTFAISFGNTRDTSVVGEMILAFVASAGSHFRVTAGTNRQITAPAGSALFVQMSG